MKIAHICHSFSKLSETFIYDYITGLQQVGIDNHVITFQQVQTPGRLFAQVHELNLPLWNWSRIWQKSKDTLKGRDTETSAWPVYRKKLRGLLENLNVDVVHAHFGPMGVFAAPVAKELDLPLVVTFYGYDISQLLRDDFWQEKYHQLADEVAGVTVLSRVMKKETVNAGFYPGTIYIIHLGRDLGKFSFRPPSGPVKDFLSVGRLSEKKGHLDTLKAFYQVHKKNKDVVLKIIGEGKLKHKLQEFIANNELEEAVFLLGGKSNEQVIEEMKDSDAFILTSKTASNGDKEGTPTVLMEAQAIGLPCVSIMHSGIPEVIPEANHRFLAPEGDVNAIANCMNKLLQSSVEERKEIAALGREKVEKEFNIKTEVKKLAGLYASVIPV